jgi:glucose-6-phosphate dehydrogenase assembly protein OpcA
MRIDLTDTTASAISSSLLHARRRAGSPAMGMVLTFVVVTDEAHHEEAMAAASAVSTEHPSRVLGVITGQRRGRARLDAEVSIGQGSSGETVLLRLSGELTKHPVSVVTPLLLADSPVVAWWPNGGPDDPVADSLGRLAQRRITDAAANARSRSHSLTRRAQHYSPGDTDLAWTRLTPWRALLAAGLDQHPVRITGARIEATRANPSADLMAAWLRCRLKIDVTVGVSSGPGITSVALHSSHGDIGVHRSDGRLAMFSIPGEADRPVALQRRGTAELLAEELRRLDNDDIYQDAVQVLARSTAKKTAARKQSASSAGTNRSSPNQNSTDAQSTAAAAAPSRTARWT